MKVLLIDDEQDILDVFPMLLDDYEWIVAVSFEAAIKMLETETIDVAVIDSLGGPKGIKLAEICNALGIKTVCHTGGSVITESSFFDAVAIKPDFSSLSDCLKLFKDVKNAA